jgi:membrane-associated phospholipid phosphatase
VKLFLKFISYFFNPLALPTMGLGVLIYSAPMTIEPLEKEKYPILLGIIFLTTCIIPFISLLIMQFSERMNDVFIFDRKDRVKPFLFASAYYVLNTVLFYRMDTLNPIFILVLTSITITVVFCAVVTFWWKISIHTTAVAGMIGVLLCINHKFPLTRLTIPLAGSVLVTGLVMTSRLHLKAHKPDEVYVGAAAGIVINYLFLYFAL